MAQLTATFSNILNNRNYYARIYPVNPQGSMQSELGGQVTMDAATPTGSISLAQLSEGSIVMIPENGVDTAFYVAKHDYESGLNGSGRTLMVRKESYGSRQWHTSDVNTYSSSAIDTWLNGDYKSLLNTEVQSAIGTTNFYCSAGGSNVTTVSIFTRSVFLLSATELGKDPPLYHIQGSKLPIASTLNVLGTQWTRTRVYENTTSAYRMSNGSIVSYNVTNSYDIRPCFTLPSDIQLSKTPNADGSYSIITFPSEPSGYELIDTYTESQTWTAPEDGWYQIEVFGASGNGGKSAVLTTTIGDEMYDYYGWSGGGGGSGGYTSSIVKLNKDDLVLIVIGAVGSDTTVTINPTTDETYDVMKVTSGGNGSDATKTTTASTNYGKGGSGGIASGGNIENINGNSGNNGNYKSVDYHYDESYIDVAGGLGGIAAVTSGTVGGNGASITNQQNGSPTSGSAGFIKIYRGDTNVIS